MDYVPLEYQSEVTLFLASGSVISEYLLAGSLPYPDVVKHLCFIGARSSAEYAYYQAKEKERPNA